jgi:hypothetical protein
VKKREWKARAKRAEADAEHERANRLSLQSDLFRLRSAVVGAGVATPGITFGGWVDEAIRLIDGRAPVSAPGATS